MHMHGICFIIAIASDESRKSKTYLSGLLREVTTDGQKDEHLCSPTYWVLFAQHNRLSFCNIITHIQKMWDNLISADGK